MDYTEIINEFAEGAMNVEKEEQFFLALASNEELRVEFKHSLAIESALMKDAKSIHPSSAVTNALFARLGFESPAPVIPQPTLTLAGKLSGLMQKFSQGLIGSITTAAALLIFYFAAIDNNAGTNTVSENLSYESSRGIKAIEAIPRTASFAANAIPVSKSSGINNNAQSKSAAIKNNYKIVKESIIRNNNVIIGINSGNNTQPADGSAAMPAGASSVSEFNSAAILSKDNAGFVNHSNAEFIPGDDNFQSLPVAKAFDIVQSEASERGWELNFQLDNELSSSFAGSDFSPNASVFRNIGLSAYYRLNDNWSLGLDMRSENFFRTLAHRSPDNMLMYDSPEKLNLISAGIGTRVDFLNGRLINPYAGSVLGINGAGLVGRLQFGFEIAPIEGMLAFNIGLEQNYLFSAKAEASSSQRFSLVYGVSLKM